MKITINSKGGIVKQEDTFLVANSSFLNQNLIKICLDANDTAFTHAVIDSLKHCYLSVERNDGKLISNLVMTKTEVTENDLLTTGTYFSYGVADNDPIFAVSGPCQMSIQIKTEDANGNEQRYASVMWTINIKNNIGNSSTEDYNNWATALNTAQETLEDAIEAVEDSSIRKIDVSNIANLTNISYAEDGYKTPGVIYTNATHYVKYGNEGSLRGTSASGYLFVMKTNENDGNYETEILFSFGKIFKRVMTYTFADNAYTLSGQAPDFIEVADWSSLITELAKYQKSTDSTLTTTAQTVVGAINELKTALDSKQNASDTDLTTTAQTIDGAINELKSGLDTVNTTLGSETLSTTATTIKSAINELKTAVDSVQTDNGTDELTTTAQTVVGAINELNNSKENKPNLRVINSAGQIDLSNCDVVDLTAITSGDIVINLANICATAEKVGNSASITYETSSSNSILFKYVLGDLNDDMTANESTFAIRFIGTHCKNGKFIPKNSMHYNISFKCVYAGFIVAVVVGAQIGTNGYQYEYSAQGKLIDTGTTTNIELENESEFYRIALETQDLVVNFKLEFLTTAGNEALLSFYHLTGSTITFQQTNVMGITYVFNGLDCSGNVFTPKNGRVYTLKFKSVDAFLVMIDVSGFSYDDLNGVRVEDTLALKIDKIAIDNKHTTSRTIDLISKCTKIEGKYYGVDGVLVDNANFSAYKIPVKDLGIAALKIKTLSNLSAAMNFCAFDSSDNFLSVLGGGGGGGMNKNDTYINGAFYRPDYNISALILIKSQDIDYITVNILNSSIDILEIKDALCNPLYFNDEIDDKKNKGYNIAKTEFANENIGIYSSGNVMQNALFRTFVVQAKEGEFIMLDYDHTSLSSQIIFLDDSFEKISGLGLKEYAVCPTNTAYVVINTLNATDISKISIYKPIQNVNLQNKVWCSFGDSITYQDKWQPYVVGKFKDLTHINCGLGSSSVSANATTVRSPYWTDIRLGLGDYAETTENTIDSFTVKTVIPNNPDIVTIWGGANDTFYTASIGTIAQCDLALANKDKTTYYGAYSYIIEQLLTWKPTLKIVLATQYNWSLGNTYNIDIVDLNEATRNIAKYYGLPLVDLETEAMINKLTYATDFSDEIHINDIGGKKVAKLFIDKFENII